MVELALPPVAPAEENCCGKARVAADAAALAQTLCVQEERVVARDNTVSFGRLKLQLQQSFAAVQAEAGSADLRLDRPELLNLMRQLAKHGAVIAISPDEAKRLQGYFAK